MLLRSISSCMTNSVRCRAPSRVLICSATRQVSWAPSAHTSKPTHCLCVRPSRVASPSSSWRISATVAIRLCFRLLRSSSGRRVGLPRPCDKSRAIKPATQQCAHPSCTTCASRSTRRRACRRSLTFVWIKRATRNTRATSSKRWRPTGRWWSNGRARGQQRWCGAKSATQARGCRSTKASASSVAATPRTRACLSKATAACKCAGRRCRRRAPLPPHRVNRRGNQRRRQARAIACKTCARRHSRVRLPLCHRRNGLNSPVSRRTTYHRRSCRQQCQLAQLRRRTRARQLWRRHRRPPPLLLKRCTRSIQTARAPCCTPAVRRRCCTKPSPCQ
mmetsp:Transcript_13669/g.23627  ORF Transcript_13669/g.23627 Transcript_13669/m.23627 type:complete len:333 (-) Transcript_13669:308-1306(-)